MADEQATTSPRNNQGTSAKYYVADCDGLQALGRTINKPLVKVGFSRDPNQRMHWLNRAAYGGWPASQNGPDNAPLSSHHEPGWDTWRLAHLTDGPDGTVEGLHYSDGAFVCELPDEIPVRNFDCIFKKLARQYELKNWLLSEEGLNHWDMNRRPLSRLLRYSRNLETGGPRAAEELYIFDNDRKWLATLLGDALIIARKRMRRN